MAFTPEQLVKAWQARAGRVPTATRRIVRFAGNRMLRKAQINMRRMIYAIPEDKKADGSFKWRRTNQLFLHEQLIYAPNQSAVALTNDMIYANSRHELGRDGRNTNRPAHWRDGIAASLAAEVQAEMQRLRLFEKERG
jgi:hypothetical protein